jgi:hypothetical protein
VAKKYDPDGPLSSLEDVFATQVAMGKSQAAAFRIANPRSIQWKENSVYGKASLLMNRAKVQRRVEEVKAMIRLRALWSRDESVLALKSVIDEPDRKSDVVAAVRELNAMHGFHEAQKIEHSGSITSIERRIVDVTTAHANVLDSNVPGVSSKRSDDS